MKKFKTILKKTQEELYNYLIEELKIYGYNITTSADADIEFIAAKGNIPIVLVAHLDTVFPDEKRKDMFIFHDKDQDVLWSPNGLGTDDRAGVYMILKILEKTNLRPHILFTTNEETKATGAIAVCNMREYLFGNVSYIIELDRQGYQESVFYECANKQFEEYVNSFGFYTDFGTFTDISIICPNWEVAGVNLSVGYYYEHSYVEHFYVVAWYDTYKKVIKMLEDKNGYLKKWKYIPREENYIYGSKRLDCKSECRK